MNGYICFYKAKQLEVHADTQLQARDKAAAHFKARKAWEVTAILAEKDGAPVIHAPQDIGS